MENNRDVYAELYEKLTNVKEDINLIEKQKFFEIKYNKRQRRQILQDALAPCLQPLLEVDSPELTEEERAEFEYVLHTALEILCILIERQTVTMNVLIEMVIERDELNKALDIAKVVQIGYNYGLWNVTKDKYTRLHNVWELDDKVKHTLEQFRFVNPMIVKPLPVNQKGNNRGSGYLTIGSDSLLLGGQYHTKDICTEILDKLNDTAYEINTDLMRTYRNSWKHMHAPKKANGIDQMKDETMDEYNKRIQAFEDYEKLVFKSVAEIYNSENQMYLTHKYDKRGRVYCVGYQLSYQSNSYGKAILNFKNKQTVTDEINFFEE